MFNADPLILQLDKALRTLSGQQRSDRETPAAGQPDGDLSDVEQRHSAGLMRVNHTGEICAQALYEGQALTARDERVRETLLAAASEEADHLAWCADRLDDLDARPSVLNPLFYGASFALGALTGLIGDRVSLGFVEATEHQVSQHLDDHLDTLPAHDHKSRAVVEQMRREEEQHGQNALAAGGDEFPLPIKRLMRAASRLMTETAYRG